MVSPVGSSARIAFAFAHAPGSAGPPPDPLLPELTSLEYAAIAVAVLGVLAFSAEHSTGLTGTTFTAAPRRRAVLAAKAVVLAAVMLAAAPGGEPVLPGLVPARPAGLARGRAGGGAVLITRRDA